ncbi:MAG: hypothetical protein WCT11_02835 [Candidatus Magasanikbacteria bacterium]|jgi:hypothetical protein
METSIQNGKFAELKIAEYNPLLASKLKWVNSAIFLSNCLYHHKIRRLEKDEWMELTINNVYNETGLNRWKQAGAVKRLKDLELIETKLAGMPSTRRFKINFELLEQNYL